MSKYVNMTFWYSYILSCYVQYPISYITLVSKLFHWLIFIGPIDNQVGYGTHWSVIDYIFNHGEQQAHDNSLNRILNMHRIDYEYKAVTPLN